MWTIYQQEMLEYQQKVAKIKVGGCSDGADHGCAKWAMDPRAWSSVAGARHSGRPVRKA